MVAKKKPFFLKPEGPKNCWYTMFPVHNTPFPSFYGLWFELIAKNIKANFSQCKTKRAVKLSIKI